MLTLDQIQHLEINALVAREAYEQAGKRLADELETKKVFEQKASSLFTGYIAIALALFGVAGAIYRAEGWSSTHVFPFILSGVLLIAGAACFVAVAMDSEYGAIASDPAMWLNAGTIDGDDSVLPLMLAYITYHHKARIDTSVNANNRKADFIKYGIWLGLATPIALILLFMA